MRPPPNAPVIALPSNGRKPERQRVKLATYLQRLIAEVITTPYNRTLSGVRSLSHSIQVFVPSASGSGIINSAEQLAEGCQLGWLRMEKSSLRCDKVAADDDEKLTVLIIEPRRLFEECLSYYLSRSCHIETISMTTVGEWPKLVTKGPPPDLILLCVAEGERLPSDPSEVVMASGELRLLPVVVMTNERPPSQIFSLLKAGFRGFIPTDVSCALAAQVLRLVKAGGTFVPASSLSSSLPDHGGVGLDGEEMFTGRQRQVIEAIRLGKPNKVIAYELNMCESTVKVHVRTIMKKLKARNRTEVAYLYSSMVGDGVGNDESMQLYLPHCPHVEN